MHKFIITPIVIFVRKFSIKLQKPVVNRVSSIIRVFQAIVLMVVN